MRDVSNTLMYHNTA